MILAITGLHGQPFDRLVRMADSIACETEERVVIQKGSSTVQLACAESFEWIDHDSMLRLIEESDIIISHAGVGTILDARAHSKPIIVVPRRRELGEAVDDHQSEIARELASEGSVAVAESDHAIRELLDNRRHLNLIPRSDDADRLVHALALIISKCLEDSR